jgi:DNA-binding MarR family transcriptional regulator
MLGITKQAVGQLVASLEEMSVVECTQDPSDKRVQLLRFTAFRRKALLNQAP